MSDEKTADPDACLSSPLSEMISAQDRDTLDMVAEALEKEQVMLAYQPVVQAAQPDRTAFYEGLIRVQDHKGRTIPARDFIEVVETQEMGRILDTLALEKGLEALKNEPALRLSINMSARSIGYPRWKRALWAGLRKGPTISERLILEITERSANTLPEIVQVFMKEMHMQGVSFALDNFGSGYTSFKYLKDFYFDILKIDGMFIDGIHADPDSQIVTRAIMSVAKELDMFTVAANVETFDDAEMLVQMGVDCMQGYYVGAPTVLPSWKKCNPQRMTG